ncbi:MAG: ATP-binding cassette domain-containing protein, partial [Bacilli bacterium]
MSELLTVKELTKYYPIQRGVFSKTVGYIKAVDNISFTIKEGETLGLVGESGCGKSTTGKSILRLTEPTTGSILFNGVDITHVDDRQLRNKRKDMQMIFQDPYASLNPRKSIEQIIEEPLIIHNLGSKTERKHRVRELLSVVGLSAEYGKRYPHQFSGGQRQRIGIARALAVQPKLIIADEPVSALDVSIQSQVLNLLKDLQVQFNLTYLFIAHDLSV